MNDENFYQKKRRRTGESTPLSLHQNAPPAQSGAALRPSRQAAPSGGPGWHVLPDRVGAGLLSPPPGWLVAGAGRLGVRLAAFSLADGQQGPYDPLSTAKFTNLKADASLSRNVGRR